MKLKITILAALAAVAFPLAAQAQDTNSYESLNVSCQSGTECGDFGVNFQDGEKVAQTRRTRTRRTRRRGSDSKIYAGGNLGIFFPGEDGLDAALDLGAKAGYKFSDLIAGEIEGIGLFGGTEVDDLGYNILGVAANAIFTYPFGDDAKSIYAFGGPGLGFARLGLTGDVADDLDDDGFDTSETGFLFQVKGGVGYPVADKIDLFGQIRYLSVSIDDDFDNDADGFSFDAGATFKF
ncbi:MAG: outer membrane beta-barrel protein [Cyanobacteria bacterium J06600_6]